MKIRLFTILVLTASLLACSKTEHLSPDRPGSEPDYKEELTDSSMRFDGLGITLKYDDGGILFDESDDGCIAITRLSDDFRIEFNPARPSLTVSGSSMKLKSVNLQEKDGVRWYRLDVDGSQLPVFIVIDI